MAETGENIVAKDMENRVSSSLHYEFRTMESKFQSQLGPKQNSINEFLQHIRGKNCLETSYEPHGEETSHAEKDFPSFWFFTSPHHTLGNTHQGHRGPKLDMQNFDVTHPMGWVSQMKHFFFPHNIYIVNDKYQVSFLYLDSKH